MTVKTCSKCQQEKKLSGFFRSGKYPSGKDKIRGDCKECASRDTANWREKNRAHYNSYMGEWRTKNPDKIRSIDMKRNYGLNLDQYNEMLKNQGGVCKICENGPKGKRPLGIDHCHSTGRVRGLLCLRCNAAIAILDDKERLEKALTYLKT